MFTYYVVTQVSVNGGTFTHSFVCKIKSELPNLTNIYEWQGRAMDSARKDGHDPEGNAVVLFFHRMSDNENE